MKYWRLWPITVMLILGLLACSGGRQTADKSTLSREPVAYSMQLDRATASQLAELALNCIRREFPNKPGHVINDAAEVQNPASLHPAFFGCFDWHSAVHGNWMLVRLLKMFPDFSRSDEIRSVLSENLTEENIASEVRYFQQPNRKSFERTYGWAWLLKLAEELYEWEDADGKRWAQNLQPLVDIIVERYLDFLPRQTYPIRRGVHPNTAFGLAFALDYASYVDFSFSITFNSFPMQFFTFQASRSYCICCVTGHLRWTTTAAYPVPCICSNLDS